MNNKIDSFFSVFFARLENIHYTKFFSAVTKLGDAKYIFIIGVCIILFFIFSKNKMQKFILPFIFSFVSSVFVSVLIKMIVKRPRPVGQLIHESGFSLPSNHATIAVAFYGFLIFALSFVKMNKISKIVLQMILFLIIIAICISRIYLRVHFATDVFVGMMIGLSGLLISIHLFHQDYFSTSINKFLRKIK